MSYYGFGEYVPVAERRRRAEQKIKKLEKKKGFKAQPILQTRVIASTFWGKAWCEYIESLSDFESRLSRGKRYTRNGSVCHLSIDKGNIKAIVAGSELYNITIKIHTLASPKWKNIKEKCKGEINSILDLLNGQLSEKVMDIVCNKHSGLFPLSKEIDLHCDCPDWAYMCKHLASVLYGVGTRLDQNPEQLFILRDVDYKEIVDVSSAVIEATTTKSSAGRRIADTSITDVFGIDVSTDDRTVKTNNEDSNKKISPFPKSLSGVSVKKKRNTLGLTKTTFAKRLGVSASTVSNWEKQGRTKLFLAKSSMIALRKIWNKEP